MLEYTVYTTRQKPIGPDEFRDRLTKLGFNVGVIADGDENTARWFVSIEPDRDSDEDTMLDAQMVLLDINSDPGLVRGAAMSLLMGLEGAENDEDNRTIRNHLKTAQQSIFSSVGEDRSIGVKCLQAGSLVACIQLGGGVIHDSSNEEFFTAQALKNFVRRMLGSDGKALLAKLD